MKLYKVLHSDGSCCNGGTGKWHLPKDKRPGKWMPTLKGDLNPCFHGYHLCRFDDLLSWLNEAIYEVEYDGELIKCDNKVVVRRARLVRKLKWDRSSFLLYLADVAEHVLYLYEAKYPTDSRVKECIITLRKYVDGTATKRELEAAAYAANASTNAAYVAKAAAYAAFAANTAAFAAKAAYAAYAAYAANAAAYAAKAVYAAYAAKAANAANAAYAAKAVYAAYAAKAANAANAAYAAEKKWQVKLLRKYLRE